MTSRDRESRTRVDEDGVRTVRAAPRRLAWLIGTAIVVPVAATIVAIAMIRMAPAERVAAAAPAARNGDADAPVSDRAASVGSRPAAAPQPAASAAQAPSLDAVTAPRQHVVPRAVQHTDRAQPAAPKDADEKPNIDARDAIPALIAAGETGGITVFPLPGTKPIKEGLVVPDDFQLPEGYVRHYQATDDGKMLPPILMFHPDYEFVNDRGEPIAVPSNRVVPPELAPAGMPIQKLDVPETSHGSRLP